MDLKSGLPFSLIRHGLSFEYPALTNSITTDVVIIGGGISGALTGYALLEAGVECVIVDARTIGLGSTCASTSLLQYEIDVPLFQLIEKIGEQPAVRAYHLCREAIEKLQTICEKISFSEFEFRNSFYFAAQKKDCEFLTREFQARKKFGFKVDYFDSPEVTKHFGFQAPAGILSHHGAHADAYCLTHHLHQYGLKKGLRVFDRTEVLKIQRTDKRVRLKTANGHWISARYVICATGYEVVEMIQKKIVSLQSTYATISESLPELPDALHENLFWNTASPYFYMRTTEDNRIVIGGRDEKYYNPSRRDKLIARKSTLLKKDFNKLFQKIPSKTNLVGQGLLVRQ